MIKLRFLNNKVIANLSKLFVILFNYISIYSVWTIYLSTQYVQKNWSIFYCVLPQEGAWFPRCAGSGGWSPRQLGSSSRSPHTPWSTPPGTGETTHNTCSRVIFLFVNIGGLQPLNSISCYTHSFNYIRIPFCTQMKTNGLLRGRDKAK